MRAPALRGSEAAALALALVAHGGLVAVLMLRPNPAALPVPQRMTVTLSNDVGMTSTSPSTAPAAEDLAPTIGEAAPTPPKPQAEPAPPKPAPQVVPVPVPHHVSMPKPEPRPVPHVVPKPAPKAVPKPVPKPLAPAKPAPEHKPAPQSQPAPMSAIETAMQSHQATHKHPAKDAPATSDTATTPAHHAKAKPSDPAKPVGGSRLGADFLHGVTSQSSSGKAKTAPGQSVGPAVKQALGSAIGRQLKRFWRVPQGVDTDQLVTFVAFDLNRDGTLAGTPRVIRQEGVNENNRLQAGLHKENAIRAVQLAAPFDLPPEYYDAWKHLTNVRFDRNLSQ